MMHLFSPARARRARAKERRAGGGEPRTSSVARSLEAIKRYGLEPEEIDDAILAAINIGLCLESGGDDSVAEGFNRDLVINGRHFTRG